MIGMGKIDVLDRGCSLPVSSKAIVLAFRQGYAANPEAGTLSGKKGQALSVKAHEGMRYPTVCLHVRGLPKPSYTVHAHKAMAYAIYGMRALLPGVAVRHGPGGAEDIREKNLRIGTYSENELDKPEEVRRAAARAGRAAQPKEGYNIKLGAPAAKEVRSILDAARTGTGRVRRGVVKELAARYGVSPSAISLVGKGKTWNA